MQQRQRKESHIRQALSLEEVYQPERRCNEKYFTIKFPRVDIESELDTIRTDNELGQQVGRHTKIIKARKDTQLIESNSAEQSEKIRQVLPLADVNVVVAAYSIYNTMKIMRRRALGESTKESLKEYLEEQYMS